MSSAITFAVGLALGFAWAHARARKAIRAGIVTGPREWTGKSTYRQEFPAVWK